MVRIEREWEGTQGEEARSQEPEWGTACPFPILAPGFWLLPPVCSFPLSQSTFVGRRPIHRGDGNIIQPEVNAELRAMMDDMVDAKAPEHHEPRHREQSLTTLNSDQFFMRCSSLAPAIERRLASRFLSNISKTWL